MLEAYLFTSFIWTKVFATAALFFMLLAVPYVVGLSSLMIGLHVLSKFKHVPTSARWVFGATRMLLWMVFVFLWIFYLLWAMPTGRNTFGETIPVMVQQQIENLTRSYDAHKAGEVLSL